MYGRPTVLYCTTFAVFCRCTLCNDPGVRDKVDGANWQGDWEVWITQRGPEAEPMVRGVQG